MKKKRIRGSGMPFGNLPKIYRIMRLFCLFMLVGLIQVSASVSAQNSKLNLSGRNLTIEQVFDDIENQSGFSFIYNLKQVNLSKKVSVNFKNEPVERILESILEDTGISYTINNKLIVIHKNGENGVSSEMLQQKRTINGSVVDDSGAPLPGVSIVIKGTTTGTITDFDGNFSLANVSGDATLLFSFVGMKAQEVLVAGQSSFNIILEEDAIGIEEVVAIGYGRLQKRDLTGSIVNIDMKESANKANVNLMQALQGAVPGVNIGVSSVAGEEPNLSIRGKTSLSGSDKPLIVLDGIIFNGSLNDLNVNDIESLDVLKDASAAAVYGSRAANGVIIITTKSGELGAPKFNLNVYTGFQDISPTDATKVMDGEQYMTRLVDYAYQSVDLLDWYKTNPTSAEGRPLRPDPTDPTVISNVARSTEEYNNWLAGNEKDWMDDVLRSSASISNYNLSVSGKNERTSYFISGSYMDQEGITEGDDYEKATMRININNQINDWLKFGIRSSYAFADYSGISADLDKALVASPWANKYNDDGTYTIDLAGESVQRNPFSNTVADNLDVRNNFFVAGNMEVDIPWVKGLKYELSYSNSFDSRRDFSYYPSYTLGGSDNKGSASRKHIFNRSWIINNIISYSKTFTEDHRVNATLLGSRENRTFSTSKLSATNFDIESLGYEGISLGANQFTDSFAEEENNIAYMARLNYTYKNRYLLTTSIRRDGFSGFSPGNKVAVFKSASLGWVMSEESFLNDVSWIEFLKLRLSYGENGNQDIGRFGSVAKASTSFTVFGETPYISVRPSSLGNSELTWETTTSLNFGADYIFLKDRLSGSIDYYNAKTEDVLVRRSIPQISGFKDILENIGEVENKGIEFTVSSVNIDTHDFKWKTQFSFSLNRNKLVKLYGGAADYDIGNTWFTGEPINSIYGYNNLGVVYTEEEYFNGQVPDGFYPGQFKIEDVQTNQGSDTYDPDEDRKILGTEDPNYRFGISNNLSYKNFNFSFFINSIQGGGDYYKGTSRYLAGGTDYARRENQPAIVSYWRPDAPTTNTPGMYWSQPVNGPLLQDRSFVRLQDVSLSYNVPQKLINKLTLKDLRFYVSGKNLATWTDWAGWDPEVVAEKVNGVDRSANRPVMRSFIIGINATF